MRGSFVGREEEEYLAEKCTESRNVVNSAGYERLNLQGSAAQSV